MPRRYWLFKSDPDTFGLPELKASPGRRTTWDGVRNYQARNLLRDQVQVGDEVLFYHSQLSPPEIVALASVVRAGHPDPTQFDPRSKYYDAAASPEKPRWYAVEIELREELPRPVKVDELREVPGLAGMVLFRRSRLSVQPVTPDEWKTIVRLARTPAPAARAPAPRPRRR